MRRSCTVFGVAAFLGLPAFGTAFAQTRGAISGTVVDGTGASLAGAAITLSSQVLVGGDRTSTSSADGSYRFPELLPGLYDLVAQRPQFQTVERHGVRVDFGMT